MGVFKRMESDVRGYCRSFDAVFTRAQGSRIYDEDGRGYLDFLAGAGTLNYGHNEPNIKRRVMEHLQADGVVHGLDLHTDAKAAFLHSLDEHVLFPLEADYKVQFTGPTGTNAVEAALKLARKITGRQNIVSFTNGFHGVSLGSLAATGNSHFRDAAGTPLNSVSFMPYANYLNDDGNTLAYFRQCLEDRSSGLDHPAAVIVETVQGEGGVNVAPFEWLQQLQKLCEEFGIMLIIDDIQVGCGRTGTFFSFEQAGISPDIVTLSKSLGGIGLPMSVVLMKREHDQWKPGEHNGTFRGNNLAFVAATEAIDRYWSDNNFTRQILNKGKLIQSRLQQIADRIAGDIDVEVRGRGMIWGMAIDQAPALPDAVSAACFERGLIIETSGDRSQVLKLLPPLTTTEAELEEGLAVIDEAFDSVIHDKAFKDMLETTETSA